MNEDRSDVDSSTPQGNNKLDLGAPNEMIGESDSTSVDGATTSQQQEEPILAVLADGEETIRSGSPFAIDPVPVKPPRVIEPLLDVGPLKYTAMGAVAAAAMVLLFAVAAAWWFPAGGTLIAALGCVLSIFGIYSHYRLVSGALLALHLFLFVYSYGQTL